MSVPAEIELAAMFVPSCASVKAAAMTKTPNLCADPPSSRNFVSRSRGFHIASPKMTVEDDDTMMPMKEVMANPMGMVSSCGRNALEGFFAKRAKSGSLTIRVAKLAIALMIPFTISQPRSEPEAVPFW
jgi:hypothetical protein